MPLLLVTESGQEISKASKKVASQAGGCPHGTDGVEAGRHAGDRQGPVQELASE